MKRGIIIAIGILVIVALCVGVLWYLGRNSLTNQSDNSLGFVKIAQKDTDNDGLSDQLETLWHTDPKNPDTNENGVSDSAEIIAYQSPTATGTAAAVITNVDDRLQALVQNAIEKKGGPLIDLDPSDIPASITFQESDLQTTDVENVASITKFRDDIRKIFTPYLTSLTGQESAELNKFVGEGDRSALLAVIAEKEKYVGLLKEAVEITVPKSAVTIYLPMLNDLGRVVETINYMSSVETEPVLALKSSQAISLRRAAFLLNFVPLNNYFVERDINEKTTF